MLKRNSMENAKIRYYYDERNDDFCHTKTNKEVIVNENYNYYSKNIFFKMFSFVTYYLVAFPILYLYCYFIKGIRVKNRKNLKSIKTGAVLYGNHTSIIDAYIGPVLLTPFRRCYIVGNKDAVSIKGISLLVRSLGCLPVPDTTKGLIKMNKSVSSILKDGKMIMIYPEAHIWHYYTGLRPFPETSFRFAASNNVPAVPIAVTYQHRKGFFKNHKPRMIVYVGKPIYGKSELTVKENASYLCSKTHKAVSDLLNKNNGFPRYTYIKKYKNSLGDN